MKIVDIRWFDSLESTNEHIVELVRAKKLDNEPVLVAAKQQTKGKGRKGRSWITRETGNLTFSLYIDVPVENKKIPTVTLVSGLAVAQALKEMGIEAKVKWPNDVMVNGRKICGILTELVDITELKTAQIIIGIGINVNMSEQEAETIDKPTTSISIELGEKFKVEDILESVVKNLEMMLSEWIKDGFSPFIDQWNKECSHLGKQISVSKITGETVEGEFAGISDDGGLKILKSNGSVETLIEGDIAY